MSHQVKEKGLDSLEYYQRLHSRNTWIARLILLTVIFGMMSMNMWMTQRNYEALVINVDQARLAQVHMLDITVSRVKKLEKRFDSLERTILEQRAQAAVTAR
jgi:flagellar biosynthesis/type III secretory pathway M-ring protein FliF/YscJ